MSYETLIQCTFLTAAISLICYLVGYLQGKREERREHERRASR
jgi:hypothetical protein